MFSLPSLSLPYIPLLSSTLPPPPGPYAVGYATVRAPARPWSLPSPVFTAARAGEPALRIQGSTWALYYPSSIGGGVQWLPEPVAGVLRGYDRYFGAGGWLLPLVRGAAARYTMPLAPNAPLRPPTGTGGTYPLVIFSHGVCGTRNTYSQWAAALASEGYVVLAVEHGDGSGPCVVLPDGELGYTVMRELDWEGSSEPTPSTPAAMAPTPSAPASAATTPTAPSPANSLSSSSLSSSSSSKGQTKLEPDLRALQLDQRVRELYAAHEALVSMLSGTAVTVDGLSASEAQAWAAHFAGRIDTSHPALAGHSFGASTVFRALEAPPDDYAPLRFSAALALDHWWEPFPHLTHRGDITTPILAINSQEYTQAPQWVHILAECRRARATLVTILGTNRAFEEDRLTPDESFCDFPVIVTASPGTELAYLATVHRLTLALLRGTVGEELQGQPDGGEYARTWMGRMAGRRGDVVVHLRRGRGAG